MASPGLSEIVTTTQRNRTGKLADNVSKNTALYFRLKQKGKVKPVNGGRTIVQEIEYAENSTFGWYSGYDVLSVQPSDVMTAAEFNYAQAYCTVSISGLEEIQNSGPDEVIDMLTARIANAEKTLVNNLSVGAYSDGTAAGGKQMGGLALLVPDNPTTGTVGGINRATASGTFWRSQKFSGVTDGGVAVSAANIQSYMNRLWLSCVRGTDRPDIMPADNNYFRMYWESLQSIQRITSPELGQAGFANLKFMDADVVFDGGIGGAAQSNHMWMLNSDYIFLRPHSQRQFVPLEDRYSVNQDALAKIVVWAGNMTLSNGSLQGVIIA